MELGLVLEGGASRSYFSAGVMDALMDAGIWADYCIGASAGIANGISYMSRQRGRALAIGLTYLKDKRYMGLSHLLSPKNKSYYNIPFVFDAIPNQHLPFDYDTFARYCKNTYAAVTNMKTGLCEYVPLNEKDPSWRSVVASCALPILFPPISLGGELYMDGGIADPIPVARAISDGCKKVIVVLTRERSYEKHAEKGLKAASFIFRKYPAFVQALARRTEVYNKTRQLLWELEKSGRCFVLAPKDTTGWRRTEDDPQKIQSMYDEGMLCVNSQMDALTNFLK